MTDCIFCKIAKGEIPAIKIYEDDKTFAFLDIGPLNPGHALVIPKKHYDHITDMQDEIACRMIQTVQKVSKAVVEAMGAQGFNILNNNGSVAGQIVKHVHFHVIPKYEDDGWKFNWPAKKYKEGEAEAVRYKIVKSLQGCV